MVGGTSMDNIKLIGPDKRFKDSFTSYYEEYNAINESSATIYKDMYRYGKEDLKIT